MNKIRYQIIYKSVFPDEETVGSINIFPTPKEAWFEVISDCSDDSDIVYIIGKIASGDIYLKKVNFIGGDDDVCTESR